MPARSRRAAAQTLRDLAIPTVKGCRILGTPPATPFLDGSEERVLRVVRAASDQSSMSDELACAGLGWPDRYHLSSARTNVLRGFQLPASARVLEIGAGCGAVTRFLGERCAHVDALEPVLQRAVVARARTEDLASVEVIVGAAADVHCTRAYDIAVVTGVLEYVGSGSDDPAPYLDFLRRIHTALVPGGTLILAIENQLGAKYLAAAPEDHTGRSYEGVEGYLFSDNHARTFPRRGLEALFTTAGFRPQVFGAFPDYKFTGMLLSDRLTNEQPDLASWMLDECTDAIPERGWGAIAEPALWRQLVAAGLGMEFANSFVVVGSKGTPASALWPPQQLAALFQPGRLPSASVHRAVVAADAGVQLTSLHPQSAATDSVRVPDGTSMMDCIRLRDGGKAAVLLQRWAGFVNEQVSAGSPSPVGWIPPAMYVDADGSLVALGDPLRRGDWSADQIVARGALVTGLLLAGTTPPARWEGAQSAADVVRTVGTMLGIQEQGWVDRAVEREAQLQSSVLLPPADAAHGSAVQAFHERLLDRLRTPVTDLQMRARGPAAAAAEPQLDKLRAQIEALRAQNAEAAALASQMMHSLSWRATRPARVALRAARRMIR